MGWKVRSLQAGGLALALLGFAASTGRKPRPGPLAPPPFPASRPSQPAPSQPPGAEAPAAPVAATPAMAATQPATPAVAPPAEPPRVLELPARTRLEVILSRSLATDRDRIGDPWEGVLGREVRSKGQTAWPKGTPVKGIILQSAPGDLLQGGGGLELRILTVGGAELEVGSYTVAGRNLEAGTADPIVRIPAGQAMAFILAAPKELTLKP